MNVTEKRITAAAMRLFSERGGTDVTVSELAAEAGVARGTLYRNITSIEQLFEKVCAQLAFEVHHANALVMDAHGDLDPPLRLATGMRLIIRAAHDTPAVGRFMGRFGLSDDTLRQVLSGPPMEDVAAGIEAGRYSISPAMVLSVASMVMGTVVSAMWMVLEGHQGWREAGSGAAELVLGALGIAPEEARQIAVAPLPDFPELLKGD